LLTQAIKKGAKPLKPLIFKKTGVIIVKNLEILSDFAEISAFENMLTHG